MIRWISPLGVAATLSACGAGCALFDTGGWTAAGIGNPDRQTLLKPLSETAPQALRLEYVIVERPAGDPLLGDELWLDLVEMGLLAPELRRSLNDNGMRVGVANSNPPQALLQLLGETTESSTSASGKSHRKRGQVIQLPSGGHTEAQTSDLIESCTLTLTADGKPAPKTFEQARGVFQVTATSKQTGWAALEFLPELHYGASQMRPVAGDVGWQEFETGQTVQKLYDQRFELTLNEGEAAVVTSLGTAKDRAGDVFFRTTSDGVPVQRLLVVRLIRTGESPGRE